MSCYTLDMTNIMPDFNVLSYLFYVKRQIILTVFACRNEKSGALEL